MQREAAIARLRVIGSRAIERMIALIRSDAPPAAHAAALKAIDGIDDARGREISLACLAADTPVVACAALSALRPWLASDAAVLDAVTAVALDTRRTRSVRLAALDVLSELPRATIQPVLQHVRDNDPSLAAQAAGEAPPATLEHPAGIVEWLSVRGSAAALSEIHDAIVRIRERERDEPSAKRRQEWMRARAAAHQVLAARQSRVALYDLRETFDAIQGPLPLDFLTAIAVIGDPSSLEPLARAWATAGKDPWWRDRLAEAARAITVREKLTGRHGTIRRIKAKFPGLL